MHVRGTHQRADGTTTVSLAVVGTPGNIGLLALHPLRFTWLDAVTDAKPDNGASASSEDTPNPPAADQQRTRASGQRESLRTTSNHEHDVNLDHHPLPNPAAAEPSS
jgi:hypothetical protein